MNQRKEIAKLLLEIKAVMLNVRDPFRFTSGILSPIYCDNRLIISYPEKRKQVIAAFLNTIKENHFVFDVVAGTATAGIPHAAWIADHLNVPMVYVRAEAKSHGKKNQIEGRLEKGQRVLVIEDLISTGNSAIQAALALRDAGAIVTDCLAIFTYQFEKAKNEFSNHQIKAHALSDFETLIQVAVEAGYISEAEKTLACSWNENPTEWGKF